MGNLDSLTQSIKERGQIQPIVVDREMHLVAGHRRVLACQKAGVDVLCIFKDNIDDPILRLELELDENIHRKDFHWSEEAILTKRIDDLKRQQHGSAQAGGVLKGEQKSGWGTRDTATMLGKSQSDVVIKLGLAEALEQFPELASCKTQKDALKAVGFLSKIAGKAERLKEAGPTLSSDPSKIVLAGDCLGLIDKIADSTFDIVCTDPPYGIELDKTKKSNNSGDTGSPARYAGKIYQDSSDPYLLLMTLLVPKLWRVMRTNSHLYLFVGAQHWHNISTILSESGFEVCPKPIIWHRTGTGYQCNQPTKWPASAYEMCIFARKGNLELEKQGRPDIIVQEVVLDRTKLHPTEKPTALMIELLSRSVRKGMTILDPFAGSGKTLVAGIELGCSVLGFEIDSDYLTVARANVKDALEGRFTL
jgi:DNA modification methylase